MTGQKKTLIHCSSLLFQKQLTVDGYVKTFLVPTVQPSLFIVDVGGTGKLF